MRATSSSAVTSATARNSIFMLGAAIFASVAFAIGALALPQQAFAADEGTQEMYRLYNRWTGEHFYTSDANEKNQNVKDGWTYEGIGWVAPAKSDVPVFRMYNRWTGDHHYTRSAEERDNCVAAGWTDEGIGWYSSETQNVPLLRQYNPFAKSGTHNYTTDQSENDYLVSKGWRAEDVGWYGIAGGVSVQAQEVLDLVNVERAKEGLGPLVLDPLINKIANIKATDMVTLQYFAHESPTYGSPTAMMRNMGVNWMAAGENIALNSDSAAAVVNAWMNSPGHRANILNPAYGRLGVGFARYNGGQYAWVQMFAD